MTKARQEYIYQFLGTIQKKSLTTASPHSKYSGQEYYKLKIIQPDLTKKTIQVFQDKLANPQIWETITQGKYSKQKYLFSCRNQRGHYYLVDWKEENQ